MDDWAVIDDYPNYMVSIHGEILSCRRNIILKPQINRGGYQFERV